MNFQAIAAVRHSFVILCALTVSASTALAQADPSAVPAVVPSAVPAVVPSVVPAVVPTVVPTIPVNTVIAVRTVDLIDSKGTAEKEYKATVDDEVVVAGVTFAPVGTPAFLRVV